MTLFTEILNNATDNHVKLMTAKLLQSLCCDLPFIPLATGIWAVNLQSLAQNKEM